jgi:hypothetical protein
MRVGHSRAPKTREKACFVLCTDDEAECGDVKSRKGL